MPLPTPVSALVDSGAAKMSEPAHRRPRRKMFRALAMRVPGYAPICCDTNDPATQTAGLKKRLLRDVPEPDAELIKELTAFVGDWLKENMTPCSSRMDFESWLAATSYTEARKTELRTVHEHFRGAPPPLLS